MRHDKKAIDGLTFVLDGPGEEGVDTTYGALHGLYWLTLNLAESQPLVIAIDDLQWADAGRLLPARDPWVTASCSGPGRSCRK